MSVPVRPWYRRPWMVIGFSVGAVVLIVLVVFGAQVVRYMWLIKSGGFDPETGFQTQQLQESVSSRFANANVTADDLKRILPKDPAPSLGSPTATVQIVEFVDYQCPFSAKKASVMRSFMAKHPKDVYLVVRDLPLTDIHENAEAAAIAADCVFRIAPGCYWQYSDRLFSNQSALSDTDLQRYAQELNVDLASYQSCVQLKAPLAGINRSLDDGAAVGVQGTPTFFINGALFTDTKSLTLDEQTLGIIVDEARSRAQK